MVLILGLSLYAYAAGYSEDFKTLASCSPTHLVRSFLLEK